MNPVVWITGAGGFTGRHLARFLRSLPDPLTIVGLGRGPGAADDLDSFHEVDVTCAEAIANLASIRPPALVFHLAAITPPAPEAELWHVNVGGTHNLLQSLATFGGKPARIVLVSSAAVYHPSPLNLTETASAGGRTVYGRSKWCMEAAGLALGRETGLKVMIARPFNLIGPGLPDSLVAGALCAQFRRGGKGPVKTGNLAPLRDFLDVRDAVAAYWQIGVHGKPGEVYNVCTGRATRIKKLVQLFAQVAGSAREVVEDAVRFRTADPDRCCGCNDKLRALGWNPAISLRQSVEDMMRG